MSLFLILESWVLNLDLDHSWFLIFEIKFLLILELFLTRSWNHCLGLFFIIFVIIKTPWINLDSSSWIILDLWLNLDSIMNLASTKLRRKLSAYREEIKSRKASFWRIWRLNTHISFLLGSQFSCMATLKTQF